jgi:SulP family sulfate permease
MAEQRSQLPGLSQLHEAVAQRLGAKLPNRNTLRQDLVAGLSGAIGSVSDGMAGAILASVNPIFGLYASMAGPLVGGLFASTQLILITTTSASALAAGEAVAGIAPGSRESALFLMIILIGVFQVLAGVLRLGRFTHFVSYSVMTGFLTGVAALLIPGQLPTLTGYDPEGPNKLAQAFDLLVHLGEVHVASAGVGLLTLALALTLPRTRLGALGTLTALVIPSVAVALFELVGVATVRDIAAIPQGLPLPDLPSLTVLLTDTASILTGALAVAAIILVQGAGVSQSVPNPDGSRSDASRDFLAQGLANVASGLFRGLPVGGSVNQTALNVVVGARSRWAAVFSGLWMALILAFVPGLVGYVAMPSLAALLIIAGWRPIKPAEVRSIMSTGWPSALAASTTFVATLLLPIQAAVGIGVVLSALLYLNASATAVRLVELARRDDGAPIEREPPKQLPSERVTGCGASSRLRRELTRSARSCRPSWPSRALALWPARRAL